jgi:hypothetical protein
MKIDYNLMELHRKEEKNNTSVKRSGNRIEYRLEQNRTEGNKVE